MLYTGVDSKAWNAVAAALHSTGDEKEHML